MDSLSICKLPVIDLSRQELKPGTSSWVSTCKDVSNALEEYGCFVTVFNELPQQIHKCLFECLKEVHDLPLDTKVKNVGELSIFGYLGSHPLRRPLFEGMGFNDAITQEAAETFTSTLWPSGNDHLCETVLSYTRTMSELEQMVMRMLFESYGVKHPENRKDMTNYLFRTVKYNAPTKDGPNLGLPAHRDKHLLSILDQNQVNGLQLQARSGQWIVYERTLPSSFVVMAGDALLAWSNGRIYSPLHTVIMSGSEERYSALFFSQQKGIIKVPEELIDEEHPLQFKDFDHFEMLSYFITEGNFDKSLKSYCGV